VSSQGTDPAEQEANYFSASLLMPKSFVERDLEGEESLDLVLDDALIQSMAQKYKVSSQALAIRLKTLGYIHD
jgi:Zn-dependent peptidase ImmA (M78 family)